MDAAKDAELAKLLNAIEQLRLYEREDGGSTRDAGSPRTQMAMESIVAWARRLAATPAGEDERLRLPFDTLVEALIDATAAFADRVADDPDHDGMWPPDVCALRDELKRRRTDVDRMPIEVDGMTVVDILDGILRPADVESILAKWAAGTWPGSPQTRIMRSGPTLLDLAKEYGDRRADWMTSKGVVVRERVEQALEQFKARCAELGVQ